MKKKYLLTGTVAILACFSLIGLAQEGTKPAGAKPAQATKVDKGDSAKKGRLPDNYGKLGLTEAQKAKIYGIQGTYDDQLDALTKQLNELKGKRDQEVETVLTDDQRKILKNLVDAAKEAKTKSKQDAAPTEEPAKTDAAATSKETKK